MASKRVLDPQKSLQFGFRFTAHTIEMQKAINITKQML